MEGDGGLDAHTGLDRAYLTSPKKQRKKERRRRGEKIVIENTVRVQYSKSVAKEHLKWN